MLFMTFAAPGYDKHGIYPHIFIAGKARQLADWASQTVKHQAELDQAIEAGKLAVLRLSLRLFPLSLEHLAFLKRTLKETLEPLAVRLAAAPPKDEIIGAPSYNDFIYVLPALVDFWTYCDFFRHAIDTFLEDETDRSQVLAARRRWIRRYLPMKAKLRERTTVMELNDWWLSRCKAAAEFLIVPRNGPIAFRAHDFMVDFIAH